jgi:hypothetical protein
MNKMTKIEIAVSGLGPLLTALGILIHGCFSLAFVGVVLTAIGVGMLWRGSGTEG